MSENTNPLKRASYTEQVARSISWGHYFIFLNILLACLEGAVYVYAAPPTHNFVAFAYLFITWLGHMSFLTVVSYLVFFFPLAFIGNFRYYRVLAVVIAVLLHTLLLFDIKIYLMVKVHLSMTALNLIISELDFSTGLNYNFLYFAVPVVIALEAFFAKITTHSLYKAHHPIFVRSVIIVVGSCFVCSHLMHIWADAIRYEPVTVMRSSFPLHYPMTAKSFLNAQGWLSEKELQENQSRSSEFIRYPLSKVDSHPMEKPYNILVVSINGLSSANLRPELTPELLKFKQGCQSFENHYLLYQNEMQNVFSSSYSLPLQYRSAFLVEGVLPVTMEEMLRQEYMGRIIISQSEDFKKDDEHAYSELLALHSGLRTSQMQRTYSDSDALALAAQGVFEQTQAVKGRPFAFGVILNDLRNYRERGTALLRERFQAQDQNYELVANDQDLFRNDLTATRDPYLKDMYLFETTLKDVDSRFGALVQSLEEHQVFENTVVVVTSFEGCMLLQDGTWLFDRDVQRVPLFIRWPEALKRNGSCTDMTSPQDLAPTFAQEVLGITTPVGDYSLGQNLHALRSRDFIAADHAHELILIGKESITVYSQDGSSYVEHHGRRLQVRPDLEDLIRATRDLNRFLR